MSTRAAAAAIACAAIVASPALAATSAVADPAGPAAVEPGAPGPLTTPNTDACPYRAAPPPPVDSSEVPAPGETAPAPLPVPAEPVGGGQLDECGATQPDGSPPLPTDISAAGWVLADLDTGEVLAAKDPHGRHRPASTIKILLATLALDRLDLDTVVTATDAEANVEGSRVGVGPGGTYSVHMLLRGLMMNSGNDAAQVLADRMGGTDATVSAMNALAEHLGALDTRTPTPAGLDGPGMSTSAYDLALMFRDAMENPEFADLVSHGPVTFPGYPKSPSQIDQDRATVEQQLANGVAPVVVDPSDPSAASAGAVGGTGSIGDGAGGMPAVDPVTGLAPPTVGPDGAPVVAPDNPGFLIVNDNHLLSQYPGAIGGKTGYTDDAGQTFVGAAERNGRRLVVTLLQGTRQPVDPWQQAASLSITVLRCPPMLRWARSSTRAPSTPAG
ncbi:MAG: serine hydrolase [Tomitella sp.]|nr:serine hydrolase [Tomitella sp.]